MLNEKSLSINFHKRYIPVLISDSLLRRYGCGQVDLSYLLSGKLILIEVKSSVVGIRQAQRGQMRRLERSAAFLQATLNIPTCVKYVVKKIAKG